MSTNLSITQSLWTPDASKHIYNSVAKKTLLFPGADAEFL